MYVQEVFVRLATPSLGTVWVFVCSLLLEAANMSLPLLATHTFANKHIQALNNLCTRLVTTASNDVRRLYARTARSRFRSLRRISRRKIDPGLGTNSTIIAASMDIKGSISGSNAGSVAGSKETTQQETMSEAAMALDVVVPMDLSSPIMSDPLLCEAVKTYFFAFLAKMASFITFAVSYPVFIGGPNAEWYHVPGEIENSPTKTWTYLGIHVIPVLLHCVFSTIYLQRQCKFDMFEYGLALLYYYIEFFIGIAFIAPAFPHTSKYTAILIFVWVIDCRCRRFDLVLGWHWNVLSYFQTHGVSAVL
ncbi:hypothetical protein DFS34DRAFT_627219 [Phlyctochytrium arcticum]|nr:hypothetical protein DFS34DRAFT_627219 [Phlyctochytrium arcticum]